MQSCTTLSTHPISRIRRILGKAALTGTLLTALVLPAMPSVAQADQVAPLVMLKSGDIWEYNGDDLTQLTTRGYHKRPVIAPNSKYVAFNYWCVQSITAVQSGLYLAQGDLPGDMGLLELGSGTTQIIATQPASINFSGAIPRDAIVRSAPAWSPDSTQIAWTEIQLDQYTYSLVVYDLATQQTTVIAQLPTPFHTSALNALDPQWGKAGIALFLKQRIVGQPVKRGIQLYSPQGVLLSTTSLTDNFYDFMWITDNGTEKLAVLFASQPWAVLNPASGALELMNGVPELYSPLYPEYSVTLQPQNSNGQITGFKWIANAQSRNLSQPLPFEAETNFAARLTVSAQGIAWTSDAVYIWDGAQRKLKNTDQIAEGFEDADSGALAWSPVAWRVKR